MKQYICFLLILLLLLSSCFSSLKPKAEDSSSQISAESNASSSQNSSVQASAHDSPTTGLAENEESLQEEAESSPYIVYRNARDWLGDQAYALWYPIRMVCGYDNYMLNFINEYGDCLFFFRFTAVTENGVQGSTSKETYQIITDYLLSQGWDVRLAEDTLLLGYVSMDQLYTLSELPDLSETITCLSVSQCSDTSYAWRIPDEPFIYYSSYLDFPISIEGADIIHCAESRYYIRPYSEEDYTKQAEFAVRLLFDGKEVQQGNNSWVAVSEGTDFPITETIEILNDTLHYFKEGGTPKGNLLEAGRAIAAFCPKEINLCSDGFFSSDPYGINIRGNELKTLEGRLHQCASRTVRFDDLGMLVRIKDEEVVEIICRYGEIIQQEAVEPEERHPFPTVPDFDTTRIDQYLAAQSALDLTENPVMAEIIQKYNANILWKQDFCCFFSTIASSNLNEEGFLVYDPFYMICSPDSADPFYYTISPYSSDTKKRLPSVDTPSQTMRSLLWPSDHSHKRI